MNVSPRRRVLFVAENITLAQLVRLVVLARALDRTRYEIHFASSEFPALVFGDEDWRRWPLYTLEPRRVWKTLEKGRKLYDEKTLERYVTADLDVMDQVKPDLVVGDLRWSLAVSAPLRQVPYAALINAYWSPYTTRPGFPMPDHPLVNLFGETLAAQHFHKALPFVFRHFAKPLNRVRARHGLPEVGSLQDVLCFGDAVLFPDTPALVPTRGSPAHHHYLGPVLWAPAGRLPDGWGEDAARPPVYVTLGSSGHTRVLPRVIEALGGLAVDVLLATAGRVDWSGRPLPSNVRMADFVPGDAATRRARLVITNGGSTSGYQALAAGTPVVGVAHNFDQYLAMDAIERAGAGVTVRAGRLRASALAAAVSRVLHDPRFAGAARVVAVDFAAHDAGRRFAEIVDALISAKQGAADGQSVTATST
jgi:UDP:flavonoid glycosyltransferase YjiC (YdhE family)